MFGINVQIAFQLKQLKNNYILVTFPISERKGLSLN